MSALSGTFFCSPSVFGSSSSTPAQEGNSGRASGSRPRPGSQVTWDTCGSGKDTLLWTCMSMNHNWHFTLWTCSIKDWGFGSVFLFSMKVSKPFAIFYRVIIADCIFISSQYTLIYTTATSGKLCLGRIQQSWPRVQTPPQWSTSCSSHPTLTWRPGRQFNWFDLVLDCFLPSAKP